LPEYAVIFHAVSLLGGINTTINPLYTADELAFQLIDANAKFLITTPTYLGKAIEGSRHAEIEEVFIFGEDERATSFSDLAEEDGEVPEVKINPSEDLVVLPYSSGTSGLPKGVMLTHSNLVANIVQVDGLDDLDEKSVLSGVLPFYHIYGMLVIMNLSLYRGAAIIVLPRFDLEQFLQTAEDFKLTRAHVVPPIVLALAKHPLVDEFNLSSLRALSSGAAPLGEALANSCAKRLGCIVKQGYGLTETSPVTHYQVDDPDKIKPAAIGPPIRNTECMIIDTMTGEALGPNQEGEVLIRGPQVMKGYLNNPEATAATIDNQGYLHTGDIGYVDDDGYFYIIDRVKELIKFGGLQVAPAELEALLLSHPDIADAAVIPSPDEKAGEVPKAFIVRERDITEEEVMQFVADRVSPHKKIRRVEFIDNIPKSAAGKILRRFLVEKERQT
jgi:acyl-CoA synthetase (AMP-forming)/AMP-acid ligase II